MKVDYQLVMKACIKALERARRPEVLTTERDCSWSLSHNRNAQRLNQETEQRWNAVRSALLDVIYLLRPGAHTDAEALREFYAVLGPFHGEEKPNGG